MANGRGAYTVLNDEQKQILAKYYDEGVIEEAASRVGVSLDKVKVSKPSNIYIYILIYISSVIT
jgi:hypothetical protein